MGYRFKKWVKHDEAGSGGTAGTGGSCASGSKSYHNGGVEGASFSKWYDQFLAEHYTDPDSGKGSGSGGTKGSGSGGTKGSGSGGTKGSGSGGTKGSGSGGTKGSGSGGTKGSGSGGTKGSGSGGTKGSGSGGTKGSGSGGTKGIGSGGTKGSGSGGTKGSGSGGTKGSGSGGTKGSGSGGTKGSGSGGTKGSGSGGTKGSGSGGTKGSGSGGTKGSGSGGTKGSGSGGTKGSGSGGTKGEGTCPPPSDEPDDGKTTLSFTFGEAGQVDLSVTETPQGQLFLSFQPGNFDNPEDIDGLFFNLTEDSGLASLNVSPNLDDPDNLGIVTDIQMAADDVDTLPNGASVPTGYDVGLQFGDTIGQSDNVHQVVNFTLWSDDGPVQFEDLDLSGMKLVVNADGPDGDVLGVSSCDAPGLSGAGTSPEDTSLDDIFALMNMPVEDEDLPYLCEEEMDDDVHVI